MLVQHPDVEVKNAVGELDQRARYTLKIHALTGALEERFQMSHKAFQASDGAIICLF